MKISFYRLKLCVIGTFIFGTVCAEDIVQEMENNMSGAIYERLNDLEIKQRNSERKIKYLEEKLQESRGKS